MKIRIVQDVPHWRDIDEVLYPVGSILDAEPDPDYTPARAKDMVPRWFVSTEIGPMGIYANEAEEVQE